MKLIELTEICLKCKGRRSVSINENGMIEKSIYAESGCKHQWATNKSVAELMEFLRTG